MSTTTLEIAPVLSPIGLDEPSLLETLQSVGDQPAFVSRTLEFIHPSNPELRLAAEVIKMAEEQPETRLLQRRMMDKGDWDTLYHGRRVAAANAIASIRLGFSPEVISITTLASLVHDVGKSDDIIFPISSAAENYDRDSAEMAIIRDHVPIGAQWVREAAGQDNRMQIAAEMVEGHHLDSIVDSYGVRSTNPNVALWTGVMACVDEIDALASTRPYRGPLSKEVTREVVGRQFAGVKEVPDLIDLCFDPEHAIPKAAQHPSLRVPLGILQSSNLPLPAYGRLAPQPSL